MPNDNEAGNSGLLPDVQFTLSLEIPTVSESGRSRRRVGIDYTLPGRPTRTIEGRFVRLIGGGVEQWDVTIGVRVWEPKSFTYASWFEDGDGTRFVDDNEGKLHAFALVDAHTHILRIDWENTSVRATADGVRGRIAVVVDDLGPDKQIELVCTTDRWRSKQTLRTGAMSSPNTFYRAMALGDGRERWQMDLALDGPVDQFEYAIVYRHGQGGAQVYEFWENNGGKNHVVVY